MSIANYAKKDVLNNAATAKNARVRVAELGLLKQDVAKKMEVLPTFLSGLLAGHRVWTDDLVADFDGAVETLGRNNGGKK